MSGCDPCGPEHLRPLSKRSVRTISPEPVCIRPRSWRDRYLLPFVLGWSAVATAGGPAAGGDNLLVNPGFDTDLAGWGDNSKYIPSWDPLDASSNPASGSIRLFHAVNEPSIADQCVPISAPERLHFGARAQVVAPAPLTTRPALSVGFYANPNCTAYLDGQGVSGAGTSGWSDYGGSIDVPAGVASIRLTLSIIRPPAYAPNVDVRFDDSYLAGDRVFADGFE